MDREEIQQEFNSFIERQFSGSRVNAAKHYGVSYSLITHLCNGHRVPNDSMLNDMGYERVIRKIEK